MMSVRHHLATSCAKVWVSPFGKWTMGLLGSIAALFVLADPFIGAMLGMACLIVFGLVWLALLLHSLFNAWTITRREGIWLWPMVQGLGVPVFSLFVAIAMLWPATWLGGRLHVYAVLAFNYGAYQRHADAESRKAAPRVLMWEYSGFLDNAEAIVWDSTEQPAKRLVQEEHVQVATCSRLIGEYYDCGMDY